MTYISVRHWRKFQHYDPAKRKPPWIKSYTDLLDNDDYLRLTARQRGILHGIWLLYAASRCKLSASPAMLNRRLGLGSSVADRRRIGGGLVAKRRSDDGPGMVRARDLKALEQAGFITFVASATLAEGYHFATPEVEKEVEKEQPLPTQPVVRGGAGTNTVGGDFEPEHPENVPPDLAVRLESTLRKMPA